MAHRPDRNFTPRSFAPENPMPTLRQLLIGALLLTLAIAVVAGIALRNAAQPSIRQSLR